MAVVDWFGLENEFEPVGSYGIASEGAVLSVLLFSPRPIEMLAGALIGVTEETSTSFRLLRLLLERFHRLRGRRYRRGERGGAGSATGDWRRRSGRDEERQMAVRLRPGGGMAEMAGDAIRFRALGYSAQPCGRHEEPVSISS